MKVGIVILVLGLVTVITAKRHGKYEGRRQNNNIKLLNEPGK